MKYELFVTLYNEALEYSDVELYIAERGWQEWMEDLENVGDVLKGIYDLANSKLVDNRQSIAPSRAEFSRMYDIPLRTLENWDSGKTESPLYVKMLIDYSIYMSGQHD